MTNTAKTMIISIMVKPKFLKIRFTALVSPKQQKLCNITEHLMVIFFRISPIQISVPIQPPIKLHKSPVRWVTCLNACCRHVRCLQFVYQSINAVTSIHFSSEHYHNHTPQSIRTKWIFPAFIMLFITLLIALLITLLISLLIMIIIYIKFTMQNLSHFYVSYDDTNVEMV